MALYWIGSCLLVMKKPTFPKKKKEQVTTTLAEITREMHEGLVGVA